MLSPEEELSNKLTSVAKKKLHKFQSKKVNLTDGLEQENIRLKEKIFKTNEKMEWMQHEIDHLRERNSELQRLFAHDFLSDTDSINFSDQRTLDAYEREERLIFQDLKRRLVNLKERFKRDSAELCCHCMGEMIEV
ncbi:hypothetical protein BD770DRAFT_393682 [Pilaira anomala]|nr:hypothetical protein BD770DRAFT_393682 [Pilaira anomala]